MIARPRPVVLVLLCGMLGAALAQDVRFEDVVGDALAYLVVPDWQAANEAFTSSDLGSMVEDEEVKAFLESLQQGSEGMFEELGARFEEEMGLPLEDAMNLVVEEAGIALLEIDREALQLESQQMQALSMVHQLENAAYYFSVDLERQPTSIDELVENPGDDRWYGPYMWTESPEDLIDPWGRKYVMTVAEDGVASFRTRGSDGEPGGEGAAADITTNWERAASSASPVRFLASLRFHEGSGPVVEKMLAKFLESLPEERRSTFGEDSERPFKGWKIEGTPALMLGLRGAHCVLASDEQSFERALSLLDGMPTPVPDPARAALMGKCQIEAPVVRGFAHISSLLASIPELPGEVDAALESSGLRGLRGAAFQFGAVDGQATGRFVMDADEQLSGLFSLFAGTPAQTPAAFATHIPSDANGYGAAQFDLGSLWQKIFDIVRASLNEEQYAEVEKMITEAESFLGFDLEADLFGALGGSSYGYSRMPQGGSLLPSSVMALQLKDAEALERVLSGLANAKLLEVSERSYRGQRLRVVAASVGTIGENPFERGPREIGEALMMATTMLSGFAFTVDDAGWMWCSARAQDLKDHLDWQLDGGSRLADNPQFQAVAAAPSTDAGFFSYSDGRPGFLIWYNSFMPMLQFAEGFARRFGMPMDMSLAPRGHILAKYMQPAVSTLHCDGKSMVVEMRMSSAGVGIMPAAAAIGVVAAIAIPNLLSARGGAEEASAISSLRTLVTANAMFFEGDHDGDGAYDYAQSLFELAEVELIDEGLGSGMRAGYYFEYGISEDGMSWWCSAWPDNGERFLYVDQTGVIREEFGQPADENSPPIE